MKLEAEAGRRRDTIERVALVSFHACPLAALGEGKAGGMNLHVRQLARSLGSLGIEVDVFTREHSEPHGVAYQERRPAARQGAGSTTGDPHCSEISGKARVVHLPAGDPDTPLEELYDSLPEFETKVLDYQVKKGVEYQAVHSHYWLSGWVGQRLSSIWRTPHVITFHTLALVKMNSRAGETEPVQRQETERELMQSVTRIVAYSPHERNAMARLYGADPRKIHLIPCGVDLDTFRPLDRQEARAKIGLDREKALLFVGRIEPLKGLELLIRATAELDGVPALRLLVLGGGRGGDSEVERMRALVNNLGIEGSVDFVGRVDHEELPVYYNAADVCVVPSFYESFGLAALESMACGTPVVATRVGGLSTIVEHGRTGYLKPWRCPEAFAGSLEMILSSKRLQQSMGRAARRTAEGMSWDAVAARVAEVYESNLPTTPR